MSSTRAPATRRKAQAEATRQRLLAAAIAAFTTRPYDAVAMGDIADAAGTAHGLPFHYFGSKRGLYLAAMHEAADRLEASHQVAEHGTPRERVRAMLLAHFRFMRANPDLAGALLRGGIGADPQAWRMFEAKRHDSIRWMCALLGLDPERRAVSMMLRALVGAIDEATVQWLAHDGDTPLEGLVEALLDLLASAVGSIRHLDPATPVSDAVTRLQRPSGTP